MEYLKYVLLLGKSLCLILKLTTKSVIQPQAGKGSFVNSTIAVAKPVDFSTINK